MDYSQFLMMPQELGLLVVFLLVFLFDTFMPKKSLGALPVFTSVIFGAFTLANYFMLTRGTAFSGMFETTASTFTMKAILNIGMLIVLVQSIKWSNSEFQAVRRGEYYELLLTTKATKAIAKRYGGLANLGDKLMKSENFEMAFDEVVWLITLLANQPILIHNLRNPSEQKHLLLEEDVELLTSPFELAEYKEAIMLAMTKGTERNVISEKDTKKDEPGVLPL